MDQSLFTNPVFGFWLSVYAASLSVLLFWLATGHLARLGRRKQLTWDVHSQYIDISEFSNKNIPLKITYKGSEPRWLWASYVTLRNSGASDISQDDLPDKQNVVVGCEGARYIGFNRLISEKAKVTLNPLFRGNDVLCKIEFDRLGAGDEILCSLLFVADEKHRVMLEGNLYGANSGIISGHKERLVSWRRLWWLLIGVIGLGAVAALTFFNALVEQRPVLIVHLQALVILYCLALGTAGVLLRPLRYWQQVQDILTQQQAPPRLRFSRWLRFFLSLSDEM